MGCIYFIGQPLGHIKIGFTNGDPHLRLRALKYETRLELKLLAAFSVSQAQQVEQELHSRLTDHCIMGEWYAEAAAQVELERMRESTQAWSPQREPTRNRDVVVRVRSVPAEVHRWKLEADRVGMTLSKWICETLNRQRVRADDGITENA